MLATHLQVFDLRLCQQQLLSHASTAQAAAAVQAAAVAGHASAVSAPPLPTDTGECFPRYWEIPTTGRYW